MKARQRSDHPPTAIRYPLLSYQISIASQNFQIPLTEV
jgi:hypothetical protein